MRAQLNHDNLKKLAIIYEAKNNEILSNWTFLAGHGKFAKPRKTPRWKHLHKSFFAMILAIQVLSESKGDKITLEQLKEEHDRHFSDLKEAATISHQTIN